MRARSIAVALFISALACTSREVIEVELPPHAGMKSAIVGRRYQGVLQLAAIDLDPFTRAELLPLVDNVEDDITLYAVYYTRTLEEMEIVEGLLTPATDTVRARPIPEGESSIHHAVIAGGGGATAWEEAAMLDDELASFRFRAEEELCPQYELLSFDTGSYDSISAAVRVDEDTVFAAGTMDGATWRVEAGGISPWGGLPAMKARAAWRAPNGELWLAGTAGRIWRGTPDGGFTELAPSPEAGAIRWIEGPRDENAPFELFALSIDGTFERFDGTTWETLRPASNISNNVRGGLVWLAPGEALAIPPQETTLDTTFLHHRAGMALRESSYSTPLFGEATSLVWVEGFGALALTKFSKVLQWTGAEFAERILGAMIPTPHALAQYRRGFVYASPGITFAEYHPLIGFCPPVDLVARLLPLTIISIGDGMVMAGQGEGSGTTPILFVKKKPAP